MAQFIRILHAIRGRMPFRCTWLNVIALSAECVDSPVPSLTSTSAVCLPGLVEMTSFILPRPMVRNEQFEIPFATTPCFHPFNEYFRPPVGVFTPWFEVDISMIGSWKRDIILYSRSFARIVPNTTLFPPYLEVSNVPSMSGRLK